MVRLLKLLIMWQDYVYSPSLRVEARWHLYRQTEVIDWGQMENCVLVCRIFSMCWSIWSCGGWIISTSHTSMCRGCRSGKCAMCTMLLHSQITTRLNQQFWSTKHHSYLTQTESSLYVKETALKAYMFLIIARNHSEKHPNNAYNHPKYIYIYLKDCSKNYLS